MPDEAEATQFTLALVHTSRKAHYGAGDRAARSSAMGDVIASVSPDPRVRSNCALEYLCRRIPLANR